MPAHGGALDEETEALTGGAKAGKPQPKDENGRMTQIMGWLWFAAACCVFLGGLLGFVTLFFTEFDPPDCLDEVYLMIFGFIMMLHESPVDVGPLGEIKDGISHQAMFLTRIVGRGAFFLFLGTMSFFTLAENVSYFFSITLGLFIIIVGFLSIVYGHAKTRQLERVRFRIYLESQNATKVQELFEIYAIEDTHNRTRLPRGLTKTEFNNLSVDVMTLRNPHQLTILPGRRVAADKHWVKFDQNNLEWIFAALVTCPDKDYLSLVDLSTWCRGSWTLL